MAKRPNFRKKDDVLDSLGTRKGKNINLSKKQDPKEKLTIRLENEIKEMVLKIEKERANTRDDVAIVQGKGGGENLEFYCEDIQNGYQFTVKDSKTEKEKPKTDFILRPVSDMDEYKQEKER